MVEYTGISYRSPRRRAQWAITLLVLVALAGIASVVFDISERDLLQRIKDGERVTLQEANASDDRQAQAATVFLVLFIVSAITFLFWFYLTYRNLYALGVEGLKYSPKWTWLGFVIPIMSFYLPFRVASEIWRASGFRDYDKTSYAWRGAGAGDIVYLWWGSFIILNFIDRILMGVVDKTDTLDHALRANFWSIISDGAYVIGAGIAILFVWTLTRRQDRYTTTQEKPAEFSVGSI